MFDTVNSKEDFPKMEERILKFWEDNEIVEKYLKRNDKSDKIFPFFDGPITANNPMGLHHAWGRTYKDVWQRYKNMQGYKQRFQNGFDCQGIWVEVEVEKDLGFNSKKEILKFGMDNFTNECKARVNKFADVQTKQSQRLGMFMDWDNSYYTFSETNNLYIWAFLKECQKKDMLYKAKSSTTWCPRCETGLSQHEQADGYMTIEDDSVYVKFKIKGKENEYFLVWTTTPWTLSANVLLSINTEYDYVKVKDGNDYYYLAKESAERLGFDEMEDVKGKDLLDLEYDALYDIPAQKGVKHYVVEWDLVDPAEGTGIVHIAPGCGQEDFELGQELGVPALSPLDQTGHFVEGYGELTGKFAHDVNQQVFDYLEKIGVLYKTEKITHSYPHCWRCKEKCLFRLEDNWFINITKIRDDLKKTAKKANWIPEFAERRMQDWLNNMGDWMISRTRFYGLALPFYECDKCGLQVVGSKEELKELAIKPELVDKLPSLHRPWIDEIKIKCPSCGKELERVTDVGDCWLDAGVVPFSTLKYFEDREYWETWYPAEFICEMIEQVRLWYYSMLVYGVMFDGSVPYLNVLNYNEVRDENGERMSKTKKNYIPFDEAAEKIGSDVVRWLYVTSSVGSNIRMGLNTADESRRVFYIPLWNTYGYLVTYSNLHGWKPTSNSKPGDKDLLDKWIVDQLNRVVENTLKYMDKYDAATPTRRIEQFVQDLSTWYIRRSRDRFKAGDEDALSTLYHVLVTLAKLLAPFVPFVSEEIYQNLRLENDPESVHLCDYPVAQKTKDDSLSNQMSAVRDVCALGQAARVESSMRVRQPLSELQVKGVKLDSELLNLVADEINVKEVKVVKSLPKGKNWNVQENNDLSVALNFELSDDLKKEGLAREIVRQIQRARKEAGLKMGEMVEITVCTDSDEVSSVVKDSVKELSENVFASSLDVKSKDSADKSTKERIFVTIEE